MFNKLPKHIHIISSCSVDKFKSQLDKHLRNIADLPCQPGYNSLDCLIIIITTFSPYCFYRRINVCNRSTQ